MQFEGTCRRKRPFIGYMACLWEHVDAEGMFSGWSKCAIMRENGDETEGIYSHL